jgi:hypothetical protein
MAFKTMHDAAVAHAALAIPTFPDEREWPDRLRDFADAQLVGRAVIAEVRSCEPAERDRRIAMAPTVWEWLLSVEALLAPPSLWGS